MFMVHLEWFYAYEWYWLMIRKSNISFYLFFFCYYLLLLVECIFVSLDHV